MNKYQAAIFDMDGTILNTLVDLCHAMNYAMKTRNHEHDFTPETMRHFFGSGVEVAVTRALAVEAGVAMDDLVNIGTPQQDPGLPVDPHEVAAVQHIFDPFYTMHCTEHTAPFKGISKAIQTLRAHGVLCALVSNKSDDAVQKLVANDFSGLFDAQMGVHHGLARKPAPDMVLATLTALGKDASQAVYIGDTEIDRQTAHNAGLDCISVSWGFRTRAFLEHLNAYMIADTPSDIVRFICGDK